MLGATLGALKELISNRSHSYLSTIFSDDDLVAAQARFLNSYLTERFGAKSTKAYIRTSIKITSFDDSSQQWVRHEIPDETWEEFAKHGVRSS